jgi:tetratricopeptide (TPR) repeat protein
MKRALVLATVVAVVAAAAVVWRISRRPDGAPAPRPSASAAVSTADIVAATVPGRRVIFIGLDGADWTLLRQYGAAGVMPTFAKLAGSGATGTLQTLHPPLSPLIWTTMLTGVSPLEHRILDFLRVNPVTGQREPITSDERKTPAIWNMATAGGKRVAVLGFWATYPAEAVNGLMVSDRLFTFLYGEADPPPGVVFPSSAEGWARDTLKRVEQGVGFEALKRDVPSLTEAEFQQAAASSDPYAHPISALRRILIETRVYDTLAREWFARERPDVTAIYIQGTDSIGHVFAPYAPPRQPSIPPADFARYSAVPERYFAEVDRMLAEYVKLAQQTNSVLVLASDHGFRWNEGRPTELSSVANATAARWHTDEGIYLMWRPDAIVNSEPVHGSVAQVCATLLALAGLPPGKDLQGPVLTAASPAPAREPVDYRARYTPAATVAPGTASAENKMDEETIAKLRALGYIGASEGGGGRPMGTRTAGSFNNEGLLLKQQGKITDAIEAFENGLTVDPNLASAAWNLSDLLFAQNQSLDKSDTLLVRAFANGLPEGTKFLVGRAIGYQRSGQLDRSLRLLDQAARAKPDELDVWLFRGRYRVEANDCRGAVNDFQQATRLRPDNAGAYASLGIAQMCVGDAASARASFERSLALDPNQPKVREYLRRGKP